MKKGRDTAVPVSLSPFYKSRQMNLFIIAKIARVLILHKVH
jgi:hypothetical protein